MRGEENKEDPVLFRIVKALFVHSIRCRTIVYRVEGTQETIHPGRGLLLVTCGKCRSTKAVPVRTR